MTTSGYQIRRRCCTSRLNSQSLDQTEYLVADRLSWMRFCGLGPGDAVPDANTLWDFREALIGAGAFDALFTRLDRAITEAGYLPMMSLCCAIGPSNNGE